MNGGGGGGGDDDGTLVRPCPKLKRLSEFAADTERLIRAESGR